MHIVAQKGTLVPQAQSRVLLLLGLLMLGVVLIAAAPDAVPLFRRHQGAAMAFAHVAALLLGWALAPHLGPYLDALAALPAGRRYAQLVLWLIVPAVSMALLIAIAPAYARELLTREWGLVEPAQFLLYLTAALLCLRIAGLVAPRMAEQRLYRFGAGAALLLAAEEVDYLGLLGFVARLFGAERGRIGGQHLGGFHDFGNVLAHRPLLFAATGLVALVVAAVALWRLRHYHAAIRRELFASSSLPLFGTVIFLGIAEAMDIDKEVLGTLSGRLLPPTKLIEEPLELLAIICLDITLALAYCRWRQPSRP